MVKKSQIKIKHNWKLLVVIIAVLILLLVVISLIQKQSNTNVEKECGKNEDCVKQQTSCCSCSMGGEEKCMSRKNASIMQNQIGDCEGIMCIALYNCKEISCSCVNGKCVEK